MNKTNTNLQFKGTPLPVLGAAIKEGQLAPNAKVTGNDLNDFEIKSLFGKPLIISVVPSLDTPVCSIQTKRFSQEAAKNADKLTVLTISMDLPFAQKRWCGAEGASNVITASDYKLRAFGENYGCYIQTLGLLARSIFVVDKAGKVTHVEYVPELSAEPDYAVALKAATA